MASRRLSAFCAAVLLITAGCGQDGNAPAGQDGWLKGDLQQKLDVVAKNLRGLDVAMIEIDHRYAELYWAGADQNWEYAEYQLDKIKLSLTNAIERRPKRTASAESFLNGLPQMKEAIARKNALLFSESFSGLTKACNTCHEMEKLSHLVVFPPESRVSSLRGPAAGEPTARPAP